MPKNNYPTFKNRSGIGSGLGYSAPPVEFFESIKNRLNNAGEALTNVQPYDTEDYGALPNEQLAGQGMRNVFNAAGAMQPPPIDLGDGAQWMPTIGALKPGVPFERLRELLAGKDPTEISPEAFGRYIKKLGPNIENTGSELTGARVLDKYGTEDPRKIIAMQWHENPDLRSSLVAPPSYTEIKGDHNAIASYYPSKHAIELDPTQILANERSGVATNPLLAKLGVVSHENQHAMEQHTYPNFVSRSEEVGSWPSSFGKWNAFGPDMEEILARYKSSPSTPIDYMFNPQQKMQRYQASIGEQYKWRPGESPAQGFIRDQFGRNPYGAQLQKSFGHFKDYGAYEFEYPQKSLAIENILKGGDVHPDIVKRYGLDPYFDQYKGGRQISNPWEKP